MVTRWWFNNFYFRALWWTSNLSNFLWQVVPAQRLTFNGRYNAAGSFSPDGQSVVLITNQGNGFRVGIFSMKERKVRELTLSRQDESPTFAPNGDMIMYANQRAGRNLLATVSTDGKVQQSLKFQGGSVREPSWSPFNRKL